MINHILLRTEGFDLSFEVNRLFTDHEYVYMTVVFRLAPHLGDVLARSELTSIATKELEELVTYFEEHIARLRHDPWTHSDNFVNTELGFQIQALAGEIISPCEGEFSIQCMVNVGQSSEEGPRVYVGGETAVTLQEVYAFSDSIKALLAELAASASTAA